MAEQESLYLWSATAATNATADPAIGWAEAQLPSTVNNSARAMMAAVARFVKDIDGSLTTAGSANAYTLTINGRQTPLATGHRLSFKASFANTSAATLAVTNADAVALGTKAIRGQGDAALAAGSIISGGRYDVEYDSTANSAAGAWLLLNSGTVPIGFGVLATDYATPDVSSAGVPAANTAGLLAAFAASPYVNLCGRTFYVESIAIPITAKRLFNGTLIAAGSYSASTAVVSASANTVGFTLDNVTVSVNVSTYTTTNSVALIGGTDGATVSNCSLSGIYPAYVGRATNSRIINNTFSSATFGRAIFATSDTGAASIFTVTSASPGVFTKTTHGLSVNDTVILYTTGALYTGLTPGRLCYVKTVPTANTFTVSLTLGGTAINTSGAQSGTHYYTSNGPVGLYIADNTIYKSSSTNSQGIVLIGTTDATVANNAILGGSHFGISSGLGTRNSITNNVVSYTIKEGIHTDSGVDAIISGNVLVFDSTSTDVGISVSSDNGPPAVNAQVVGNSIDSPFGAGIYFVGAKGSSAQGNKIRNANVGNTALSASIVLDGTLTTLNTIGPNTIEDSLGFNAYQVGEANYTSGAPTSNYIAQQVGKIGATGYILNVATTTTAIRASSSPASSDTVNGFWFGASAFSKRDAGASNVYLYDFDNNLTGSMGSAAGPLINWGQTTHRWSGRGFGAIFASLDTNGFALNGTTSGTSTVKAPAVAGTGVFTLPASATDTLVSRDSTDTLTNKSAVSFSATSAAAGNATPLTIVAGGNLATDVPQIRITSLAGTVVFNQFGDALNGFFRLKALGDMAFHAGNVGVSATNEFFRIATTGAAYVSGISTTASAANCFIDNASSPVNSILRSTSSARYKENIEPLEKHYADGILNLEPIWYRSKAKADNPEHSFYGFTAEQAATVDPRFVHWTYRDEDRVLDDETGEWAIKDGAVKVPDGVQYERFTVMLVMKVKEYEERIQKLEAALNAKN